MSRKALGILLSPTLNCHAHSKNRVLGSPTYGPLASSGPSSSLNWPAKFTDVMILLFIYQ